MSKEITISKAQAKMIMALLKRDEARAVIQYEYSNKKGKYFYCCPNCGKPLMDKANFCFICGQRVDLNTIAF